MYANQPAPVVLPPLHYQGPNAPQPFGYQPPPHASPPGIGGMPPPQTGMIRSADQMDGGSPMDLPPAKRQKVAKLAGGQYYPENDWINMHPVRKITSPKNS